MLTLLLFDVDGVLIYPKGYKEALRSTVSYFCEAMGLPSMVPTDEDIAVFEACGITSEWDSTPLCVGAILTAALTQQPDLVRSDVTATMAAVRATNVDIPRPDYQKLARTVQTRTPDGEPPTAIIHHLLQTQADESLFHLFAELLDDIYSLDSLTTRIFQHFALGSERFASSTGTDALFETPSTLEMHDRPALSSDSRSQLLTHLASDQMGAAIYTARPSLPPADLPDGHAIDSRTLYPPEGDLAAEQIGLAGRLPLIGGGRVAWLAQEHGRDPAAYIKPSPVQALAAIGAAFSGQETASLAAAAALYNAQQVTAPLADVVQQPLLRIVVFEDSAGGIVAVQRAVDLLRQHHTGIQCEAVGIATEAAKTAALAPIASRVVDDINQGLVPYL